MINRAPPRVGMVSRATPVFPQRMRPARTRLWPTLLVAVLAGTGGLSGFLGASHGGRAPPALRSHPGAPAPLFGGASAARPTHARSLAGPASAPLVGGGRWFNLTPSLVPSPAARIGANFAFDAADGYEVLFSGENLTGTGFDDTWTYAHGNWTQLFPVTSPGAQAAGVFVYDPVDHYVVLFGGVDTAGNVLGDTWTFAHGVWTNITTSGGPSPRAEMSAAWDESTQSVIMFGGTNGSAFPAETWRFVGGTWTQLFPTLSPSGRAGGGMAYDSADGYLVLFGGVTATTNFAETWRFSNGSWVQLTPSVAPSGRATWGMAYDPSTASVLLFGGGVSNDSVFFGDTWNFRGGGWTQLFPLASPSARQLADAAWDPVDGYLLLVTGATLSGVVTVPNSDTWVYAAPLTATAIPPMAPVDTGQVATFHAMAAGGIGPYSAHWNFGNGSTGTGPVAGASFTVAGAARANLTVTDRFGERAEANATITVNPRPTIAVNVIPSSPVAGAPVNLTATPHGGSPPLTFAWSLGDGRTRTGPGPFTVNYSKAGSYVLNVSVTDAASVTNYALFSVVVQPAPSTSGSGSSSGLGSYWWVLLPVAAVAIAAVAVWMMRRRTRPPTPPPTPMAAPTPPPVSPPPSGSQPPS